MSKFILHDVLIQDTETKKLYRFFPLKHYSERTTIEINNELNELSENEKNDILDACELDTSYVYSIDK
jgi:hypothetical protein